MNYIITSRIIWVGDGVIIKPAASARVVLIVRINIDIKLFCFCSIHYVSFNLIDEGFEPSRKTIIDTFISKEVAVKLNGDLLNDLSNDL